MFPVFHNVPRFVPDWMKTGVSVSMSLLEPCVWRLLLAMMNGADTTPAVMVTPVNHTERGDIIRALNMMVVGSGHKNKQFIYASTFYSLLLNWAVPKQSYFAQLFPRQNHVRWETVQCILGLPPGLLPVGPAQKPSPGSLKEFAQATSEPLPDDWRSCPVSKS